VDRRCRCAVRPAVCPNADEFVPKDALPINQLCRPLVIIIVFRAVFVSAVSSSLSDLPGAYVSSTLSSSSVALTRLPRANRSACETARFFLPARALSNEAVKSGGPSVDDRRKTGGASGESSPVKTSHPHCKISAAAAAAASGGWHRARWVAGY